MGPKAKDLDKGRTEWIKKLDQMKERDKDEDEDKDKDKDKASHEYRKFKVRMR